jgi:adenine/guanine phosphoribosyltransferase-like PRPP-binding protein
MTRKSHELLLNKKKNLIQLCDNHSAGACMTGFWGGLIKEAREHILFIAIGVIILLIGLLAAVPDAIKSILGDDFPVPPFIGLYTLIGLLFVFIIYLGYSCIKSRSHKDPKVEVTSNLTYSDVEFAIDTLVTQIQNTPAALQIPNAPGAPSYAQINLIIGIDRGGAIVGGILGKRLKLPVTTIGIRYAINSPLPPVQGPGGALIPGGVPTPVKAQSNLLNIDFTHVQRVFLVDDSVRQGNTMNAALTILTQHAQQNNLKFTTFTACILNELQWPGRHVPNLNFFVYHTHQNNIYLPWD